MLRRDLTFPWLVGLAAAAMLGIFAVLLGDIIFNGAGKLSWAFLTTSPENAGRAGGIASILVSTVLILTVALASAVPVGIGAAIWLVEFTGRERAVARLLSLCLDGLAGMPSIVVGLFGSAFFCVFLGLGFSILAGGLTLGCMILPLFVRTVEAGLSAVPVEWRLGAAALGLRRSTFLTQIQIPAAATAIGAGLALGIGRALAETAALLYTSGYVDRMPNSRGDSGRALAIHIYDLSMNVTGGESAAYGTALILIALVVLSNLLALAFTEGWLARKVKIL